MPDLQDPVVDAPALAAVHHVALTVRDVQAATAWYGRVLGFETVFTEEGEHRRATVMRFAGAGYSVALVEHTGATSEFDPRRSGLDHLAFAVAARRDLDEWAARLTAMGIEHSGPIPLPTGAILNFKDPDGIALALFWDRTPSNSGSLRPL